MDHVRRENVLVGDMAIEKDCQAFRGDVILRVIAIDDETIVVEPLAYVPTHDGVMGAGLEIAPHNAAESFGFIDTLNYDEWFRLLIIPRLPVLPQDDNHQTLVTIGFVNGKAFLTDEKPVDLDEIVEDGFEAAAIIRCRSWTTRQVTDVIAFRGEDDILEAWQAAGMPIED